MSRKDPESKREYVRQYRADNLERLNQQRRDRRARNRAVVEEAKSAPCLDCGGSFPPYVMDFDHRDGKGELGRGISRLVGAGTCSLERLHEEIAKCDVICANCHRIRTHKRGYRRDRNGVSW